jgi:arylsulfatase A-like enzyme
MAESDGRNGPLAAAFRRLKTVAGPVKRAYDSYKRQRANARHFRHNVAASPSLDAVAGDVLFVVVDCLRADHTSLDGYDRDTTPFLAETGRRFPNAVSAAPWTYPSVVSLLSGLYVHNHGADFDSELRKWDPDANQTPGTIHDDVVTLPELLGASGYDTYFSTAIRTAEIALHGRFEEMRMQFHAPAETIVDDLLGWWDGRESDRFAYVQFGDLHGLQLGVRHVPDDRPFGEIEPLPDMTDDDWADDGRRSQYVDRNERLYDTLARYVDDQIHRLLRQLEARGDLQDTLVVVVGDHGEGLGEHWALERDILNNPYGPPFGYAHGSNLFQELIRVPLVVAGGEAPDQTSRWVSTTDIVPTVLDRLGAAGALESPLDGRSLDAEPTDRVIHAGGIGEGYEQHAVYRDGLKYVTHPLSGPDFLYDVGSDPAEATNLIDDVDSDRREGLAAAVPDSRARGDDVELSDTAEQQMRELGYLE